MQKKERKKETSTCVMDGCCSYGINGALEVFSPPFLAPCLFRFPVWQAADLVEIWFILACVGGGGRQQILVYFLLQISLKLEGVCRYLQYDIRQISYAAKSVLTRTVNRQ